MRRLALSLVILTSLLAGCLSEQKDNNQVVENPSNTPTAQMVALGDKLFHDVSLSSQGNQACASCHNVNQAFSDADQTIPVSKGSEVGQFGTRNTPVASYTAFIPALHQEQEDGETLWKGGLFLDGRVNSLEEQAQKPFLNPAEMNNKDAVDVVAKLRASTNANLFREVFGSDALDIGKEDQAFGQMAQAIAAFERTPVFSPFSSKFDFYLQGKAQFTTLELQGMSLFIRADKGNCAACHPVTASADGTSALFTDFSYDNIGVPRHPNRQFFTENFVDEGLAKTTNDPTLRGQFRVATLRNIAKTAPYMHNGRFDNLREVVEFYNTRDVEPQRWGEAEVPETVNRDELGNLRLTDREIDAIVAFLNTLSDGYQP